MPKFIRLKLLKEPEIAPIQSQCTKTRQKLVLRELCTVDDWSRDELNEMNNDYTDKFLNVITKVSEKSNLIRNETECPH